MSKHVIFLVHGMGSFEKGWADETTKQVRDLYSSYQISKLLPFDTYFRFVEITYNGHFEELRSKWKSNSGKVIATLRKNGLDKSSANELAKYGGTAGEDVFLTTHVLDVVLYRFIPQIAETIRTSVAVAILDELLKAIEIPRWSVIAHSLGTSVAHDSLHALYTQKVGGRTLAGVTKADTVAMISNVSRLLEEKSVDVYKSVVRPGLESTDGMCRYFVNAIHDWDPIPRPREFRPVDDWPNLETRNEKRFVPVRINAFQSPNIHGLDHYLSNPRVHVALFRGLLQDPNLIPKAEEDKASAVYEASTPFGKFKELQNALKRFQIAETASWQQIIRAFKGLFDTIAQF